MDLSNTVLVANRNNSYLLMIIGCTESTGHARHLSELSLVLLAVTLIHRKGNSLLFIVIVQSLSHV